jgi:hypothetical protein
LPKPPLREKHAKLRDRLKELIGCRLAHGNLSPTDGYGFTVIGKSSITSTRTNTPGSSLATRVARVTPSLMTNAPSVPRLTRSGGIPAIEVPN